MSNTAPITLHFSPRDYIIASLLRTGGTPARPRASEELSAVLNIIRPSRHQPSSPPSTQEPENSARRGRFIARCNLLTTNNLFNLLMCLRVELSRPVDRQKGHLFICCVFSPVKAHRSSSSLKYYATRVSNCSAARSRRRLLKSYCNGELELYGHVLVESPKQTWGD